MVVVETVELSLEELREVAGFGVFWAEGVLGVFEEVRPGDGRVREAVEAGREFARGGRRGKRLRDAAWGAMRAAKEAGDQTAAGQAARAAMCAAGAAYLHPLKKATQVKHILGAAAHAARVKEILAGGDEAVAEAFLREVCRGVSGRVVEVLRRYPRAPEGGGRVGELMRILDEGMRGREV